MSGRFPLRVRWTSVYKPYKPGVNTRRGPYWITSNFKCCIHWSSLLCTSRKFKEKILKYQSFKFLIPSIVILFPPTILRPYPNPTLRNSFNSVTSLTLLIFLLRSDTGPLYLSDTSLFDSVIVPPTVDRTKVRVKST